MALVGHSDGGKHGCLITLRLGVECKLVLAMIYLSGQLGFPQFIKNFKIALIETS